MNANKKFMCTLTAVSLVFFAIAGCMGESPVTINKNAPLTNGSSDTTPPRVTVSALGTVQNYSTTLPVTATTTTYRVSVTFSKDMDGSTIIGGDSPNPTVYLRNVEGAPLIFTGQAVRIFGNNRVVYIEWTADAAVTDYTTIPLEIVVTTGAEDFSGNGVAGLTQHLTNVYPFNTIEADFRDDVAGAGAWPTPPVWAPATITITKANVSSTSVTITATISTDQIDLTTISSSNFTTTQGTIDEGTYTEVAGAGTTVITFNITGLTEDTEATATFNPQGVLINTTLAARMYPDGATVLGTLANGHFYDDFNGSKSNRSSYILPFMPQTAKIPPTITAINDVTQEFKPGFDKPENDVDWGFLKPGQDEDRIIEIQFSIAMDTATLIPENFNIKGVDIWWDSDPWAWAYTQVPSIQASVIPFYRSGETDCVRALISTMDYSQDIVDIIIITHRVTSSDGAHIDGNGDTEQDGGGDYNQNGVVDDWVSFDSDVNPAGNDDF